MDGIGIKQSELARRLGFKSTRTIQRRRILYPTIYRPDFTDRTKHPRWKPETVQKIMDWEARQ